MERPCHSFDWFLKSRTPQEIGRRCATLIGLITKEEEDKKTGGASKAKAAKKRNIDDVKGSSRASTPASVDKKQPAAKKTKAGK